MPRLPPPLLAALALVVATAWAGERARVAAACGHGRRGAPRRRPPLPPPAHPSEEPTRLDLCDCEWADAGPGPGLSCAREGFFVHAFERTGHWAAGGGDVPLARARCCRPCLPGGGEGEAPLALVSLDCRSPARGALCDSRTGGFVAGFTDAVATGGAGGAVFPVGPPRCCTPALLALNGATAELHACDCAPVDGVSCDGHGNATSPTPLLLRGFREWRLTPTGDAAPTGPAVCCAPCVGPDTDDPARDCGGGCSGRGACVLGACACAPGWCGPSCGERSGGLGPVLQVGAAAAGVVAVLAAAAAAAKALRGAEEEDESEDGADAARRLLAAADGGAGSVGSRDTDDEEGEGDVESAAAKPAAGGSPSAKSEKGGDADAPSDRGAAAVAGALCAVCADRPVQALFVPCGHACTCRRCARRLTRCPVCRADAARRQRLWVGG